MARPKGLSTCQNFPVLHCSCSNGCAIDSGADGGDPQAEVLGSIRGAEAAGESPMPKPMSLGVVQSRCASRGAVLVCICANIFQTVFARCSLQLQALLKASNPWQPALKWVMERPCQACGGHHTAPRAIHARRSMKKHEEVCGSVCVQGAARGLEFCSEPKARLSLPSYYSLVSGASSRGPHPASIYHACADLALLHESTLLPARYRYALLFLLARPLHHLLHWVEMRSARNS